MIEIERSELIESTSRLISAFISVIIFTSFLVVLMDDLEDVGGAGCAPPFFIGLRGKGIPDNRGRVCSPFLSSRLKQSIS